MMCVLVVAAIIGAAVGIALFRGLGVLLGYVDAHQVGS